jgi:hypothetical protein
MSHGVGEQASGTNYQLACVLITDQTFLRAAEKLIREDERGNVFWNESIELKYIDSLKGNHSIQGMWEVILPRKRQNDTTVSARCFIVIGDRATLEKPSEAANKYPY